MERFAVIPTHNRPGDFIDCYLAVQQQVDHIIVVAHQATYAMMGTVDPATTVIDYPQEVPNISEMWNLGLNMAQYLTDDQPHQVAVLNDDAVVPHGWFPTVSAQMQATGASIGSVDQFGVVPSPMLFTEPEPIDLRLRMSGFAFIMDGSKRLRLDEQFRWWYGDDDLEWTARTLGGVVKVPGTPVDHRHPGSSTVGYLAEVAGHDRARFIAKHGKAPH